MKKPETKYLILGFLSALIGLASELITNWDNRAVSVFSSSDGNVSGQLIVIEFKGYYFEVGLFCSLIFVAIGIYKSRAAKG